MTTRLAICAAGEVASAPAATLLFNLVTLATSPVNVLPALAAIRGLSGFDGNAQSQFAGNACPVRRSARSGKRG